MTHAHGAATVASGPKIGFVFTETASRIGFVFAGALSKIGFVFLIMNRPGGQRLQYIRYLFATSARGSLLASPCSSSHFLLLNSYGCKNRF
jgi:hypothetical protein